MEARSMPAFEELGSSGGSDTGKMTPGAVSQGKQ